MSKMLIWPLETLPTEMTSFHAAWSDDDGEPFIVLTLKCTDNEQVDIFELGYTPTEIDQIITYLQEVRQNVSE